MREPKPATQEFIIEDGHGRVASYTCQGRDRWSLPRSVTEQANVVYLLGLEEPIKYRHYVEGPKPTLYDYLTGKNLKLESLPKAIANRPFPEEPWRLSLAVPEIGFEVGLLLSRPDFV